MRSRLARLALRAARWTAVGEVPRNGVLVGAPHTSNWDFVMMLLIMWRGGVTPRVLIKKELFRGPFGWLLHRLGGLPLDRENPGSWCDTSCARPAAASRSCSSSRRREPARRASTGSRASGALRGQRTCRSPLPSSTAPPAQRDSAPPSRPRPTWSLTWTRSEFYRDKRGIHPELRTAPASARSCGPGAGSPDLARGTTSGCGGRLQRPVCRADRLVEPLGW